MSCGRLSVSSSDGFHYDEVFAGDFSEFVVQYFHAFIRRERHAPGDAVVGEDHTVLLEGLEYDLCFFGEACHVEVVAEAEAFTHSGQLRVVELAGEVGSGMNVGPACLGNGEAKSMVYFAALKLIVTNDGGEDGEAGCVGGGPTGGAKRVAVQIEDRSLGCFPTVVGSLHAEELEELATGGIDDDGMAVAIFVDHITLHVQEREESALFAGAVFAGPAFDGEIVGDGVGAFVRFIGVAGDLDLDEFLVGGNEDVSHVVIGTELEVSADAVDQVLSVGGDGPMRDVGVPGVVLGEDLQFGDDGIRFWGIEGNGLGKNGRFFRTGGESDHTAEGKASNDHGSNQSLVKRASICCNDSDVHTTVHGL